MSSKKIETTLGAPSTASWFVSLLSVFFVLGLLYVGEMISRGYYYARLQSVLHNSLSGDSDLVFTADNPEFSQLFVAKEKEIKILKPVISFVAQKDPERAAAILVRHQLESTPLNQQLERTLIELRDLSNSAEDLEEASSKDRDMLSRKMTEYSQLKADFRAYLGGESKDRPNISPPAEPEEGSFCKFYASGLLEALPVIPSLPDDIADFSQLGTFFTLIKSGETTAPSGNAAQKELALLRGRAEYLKGECEGLTKRAEEIKAEQKNNTERQQALYASAKLTLRKVLASLAKPQLDNQTLVAYDLFRASAEKYGFVLPSLMV